MHNIDKKQRKHKNELKKSEKSKIVQLALINNMHTINQGNSCKKVLKNKKKRLPEAFFLKAGLNHFKGEGVLLPR